MTERYRGMNAAGTGTLTDEDHVWQSVNDILLTPVGSRLMRRNYGSLCPDLIDSPQNDVTPATDERGGDCAGGMGAAHCAGYHQCDVFRQRRRDRRDCPAC
jgi:hypothetical protein